KLVCAAVVVVICIGVGNGGGFRATISKVEDGKVTFKKGKKGEEGPAMTLPVAAKGKLTEGKVNLDTKQVEAEKEIEKGLKTEMSTKMAPDGIRATITTDADNKNITAIAVTGGGKK